MKVLLPLKNNLNEKDELAESFHNIENVCIYDSVLNSLDCLSAKKISEVPGGLNSGLIENNVYSIISLNISPMVLTMFARNGIRVFKAQGSNVSKNIDLFQRNRLKVFTTEESREIMACTSNSCSSCGSTCN